MKVLIACESSGTVREAFRSRAHNAWSCDLLPADDESTFHFQGDALQAIRMADAKFGLDLLIAHPPCTYLSASGMHWTGKPGHEDRAEKTTAALAFVQSFMDAPIERIAIENPIGCISTRIRKPDQIIQPWMFGHNSSKKTCLWLKNLQKLKPTHIVPPAGWIHIENQTDCVVPFVKTVKIDGFWFGTHSTDVASCKPVWANQTPSGQNKLGPSATRWKERSKTYSGIAEAMARQWGGR